MYAIQGNFHNLQRYTTLLHAPERAHRRRILCMFGNTFANLPNEIMFVRSSLFGFAPGDFLLLTVPATMASASEPKEILRKDPRLSGRAINSWVPIQPNWRALATLSRYRPILVGEVRCATVWFGRV